MSTGDECHSEKLRGGRTATAYSQRTDDARALKGGRQTAPLESWLSEGRSEAKELAYWQALRRDAAAKRLSTTNNISGARSAPAACRC